MELDHVFILCDQGAPEADALLRLGLHEGAPQHAPGPGHGLPPVLLRRHLPRAALGRRRGRGGPRCREANAAPRSVGAAPRRRLSVRRHPAAVGRRSADDAAAVSDLALHAAVSAGAALAIDVADAIAAGGARGLPHRRSSAAAAGAATSRSTTAAACAPSAACRSTGRSRASVSAATARLEGTGAFASALTRSAFLLTLDFSAAPEARPPTCDPSCRSCCAVIAAVTARGAPRPSAETPAAPPR